MNHQSIVDRFDEIQRETADHHDALEALARQNVESLRKQCGALGHLFADRSLQNYVAVIGHRYCVYCGADNARA